MLAAGFLLTGLLWPVLLFSHARDRNHSKKSQARIGWVRGSEFFLSSKRAQIKQLGDVADFSRPSCIVHRLSTIGKPITTCHATWREANMKRNEYQFWAAIGKALAVTIATLILTLTLAPGARAASTQKVLYSFTGGADGSQPTQGLIFDQAGNLYGATSEGGAYGHGTVFQLTPSSDGSWTESVLYSFTGGSDGDYPNWGGLAFDTANNLYGTTNIGGAYGAGTLFELSPNSDGTWTESVLHHFTGKSDGHLLHRSSIRQGIFTQPQRAEEFTFQTTRGDVALPS